MDYEKNDSSSRDAARTLAELGDIVAFVGYEVEFSGVLTYKGNVRIDGTFEGEIETDDTLFIGEQANVKAQIRAGSVIASGRITGDITAQQRVELKSPAVIDASISTPKLSMDNGVIYNGKVSMGPHKGQGKGKKNLPPVVESKESTKPLEESSDSMVADVSAPDKEEGATLSEQS